MDCFASVAMTASLPIPPARLEPLMHMRRRRRHHAHRVLVLRNRDHQFARMQMQPRLAEARTIAVNIIAENWPAHGRGVNAPLMGPPGDRLQREPGKAVAPPEHLP